MHSPSTHSLKSTHRILQNTLTRHDSVWWKYYYDAHTHTYIHYRVFYWKEQPMHWRRSTLSHVQSTRQEALVRPWATSAPGPSTTPNHQPYSLQYSPHLNSPRTVSILESRSHRTSTPVEVMWPAWQLRTTITTTNNRWTGTNWTRVRGAAREEWVAVVATRRSFRISTRQLEWRRIQPRARVPTSPSHHQSPWERLRQSRWLGSTSPSLSRQVHISTQQQPWPCHLYSLLPWIRSILATWTVGSWMATPIWGQLEVMR